MDCIPQVKKILEYNLLKNVWISGLGRLKEDEKKHSFNLCELCNHGEIQIKVSKVP